MIVFKALKGKTLIKSRAPRNGRQFYCTTKIGKEEIMFLKGSIFRDSSSTSNMTVPFKAVTVDSSRGWGVNHVMSESVHSEKFRVGRFMHL